MKETNWHYHADTEHLGHTMLEVYRKSPKLFKWAYRDRVLQPEPPTPSMVLGSLTHSIFLEPRNLNDQWVFADCAKRAGKKWLACCEEAKESDREPALLVWRDKACEMSIALNDHPLVRELLEVDCIAEEPLRWTDRSSGLKFKCKPDFLIVDENCESILDVSLKTTGDPSPEKFGYTIADYGYHRGSAHYAEGILYHRDNGDGRHVESLIIACGNTPPYDVWVYRLSPAYMELGHEQNARTLANLARSIETDTWISEGQHALQTIEPPRRARSEA